MGRLQLGPSQGTSSTLVTVSTREAINYALMHNRVPLISAVEVANSGTEQSAAQTLQLSLDPVAPGGELAEHLRIDIPQIPPGEIYSVPRQALDWPLNLSTLLNLEAPASTHLRARVAEHDDAAPATMPVRALPADAWWAEEVPESLAAFIRPQDEAISQLLDEAAEVLEHYTGSAEITGYQSGPGRVRQIVRAIYHVLAGVQLNRVPASADLLAGGHSIRPPTEVLNSGRASTLELVTVFAAALERAQLHSVVAISSRHPLLGWLAEPGQLPEPIIDNPTTVATVADSQLFEMLEVDGLFRAEQAMDFDAATEHARHWWSSYEREQLFLLDVRAAHRRISPLPTIRWEGETRVVEVQRTQRRERREPLSANTSAPATTPAVAAAEQAADASPAAAPPRIEGWRRSLLDLSYRNPLLRLSASASVPLHVPSGALDLLVELITTGTRLTIDEHSDIDDLHKAQGARTAADVDSGVLTDILEHERRIFAVLGFTEFLRRLRSLKRRARTAAEETGANPLYLAAGLLRWEEVGPRGGRGPQGRAPLFLVPVTLTGGRGRTPFRISVDDTRETVANISLVEKLRAEQGITLGPLTDPPLYEGRIDVLSAAEQLRRLLLQEGMENFAVEESAHLALARFSTLDLWRDLSENWAHFMHRPAIRHLVERPGQHYDDAVAAPEPDPQAATTMRLPVPADGSQLEAVRWAAAGKSFILEGPPGTGKSQTITNLIAECLHRGKKVLFVAEKQAALEVVQRRLDQVGLGAFVLDVHGRKQSLPMVRDQIRQAVEATATKPVAWDAVASRAAASADRLARYPEQLHGAGPAGLSTWQAHQLNLELRALHADAPEPAAAVDREAVSRLGELNEVYREAAELDQAVLDLGRSPAGHPWSLARAPSRRGTDCDREATAAAVTELLAAEDALPDSEAAQLLGLALTVEQLEAAAAWLDALIAGFRQSALQLDTVALHQRAQQIDDRLWPFGKNRRRRQLLEEIGEHLTQPSAVEIPHLTSHFAALDTLRQRWKALRESFGTDPDRADKAEELATTIFRSGRPDEVFLEQAHRLSATWKRLTGLLGADQKSLQLWARGTVGSNDETSQPARSAAVAACAPAWRREAENAAFVDLARWDAVSAGLESLCSRGLTHIAEAAAAGQIPVGEVQPLLRRALTQAALDERLHSTGLHRFDQIRHHRRIEQFSSSSAQRRELLRSQLPAELIESRSFSPGAQVGAVAQLRQQLGRRRGGLRIRQLFERYGELITEAAPCLLMSPDSVARFLPADAVEFDVVVFDEASQVQVPESIGAIGRARSVVIVGDTKQMPPTTAFSHAGADEGNDDALVPVDLDSILSEAHESGLPRLWLSWHYRSKHEELIAFSNEQYYQGQLSTFPAPPGAAEFGAVQLRVVDGTWEGGRGAARVNRREAQEVLTEISGLLTEDPQQSVGVVTFNAQQRDLLLDKLEAITDPLIQEALDREQEPLFVKNLENVQGDERDAIVFTLAFSRNESGRVPLQWGTMTSAGGERRLNVAITRARRTVRIISSFQPHELDLRNSTSQGLADLKEYLLAAHQVGSERPSGHFPGPQRSTEVSAGTPADRHAAEVQARLQEAGLEVIAQLGLSGFHVDFAVRSGQRPWVAVLLDGPQWAARSTVGDRDVLPAAVLTGSMGWSAVERIWLPEWLRDPETAVSRIRAAAQASDSSPVDPNPPAAAAPPVSPQGAGGGSAPSSPAPITVTQRHVGDVPYAELRDVMLRVLRRSFRAPQDELLRRVARLYGHQRMGSRIQQRLEEVFQQAVAEAAIVPAEHGEYQPGVSL